MAIAQQDKPPIGELDRALSDARESYLNKRPGSVASFEQSVEYMPGGNTRTVLFHGAVPLRIVSGNGCRITDADGLEYIDMLGEYTAGVFGHNHPVIRSAIDQALDQALDRGLNLSGHNPDEIELARVVCERFPSIDKVRFTNSGTEANLLAISIACFYTKRKKVMVFEGGYHGGLLYFRGGGMPINAPFDYVVADYNDIDGTRELINQYRDGLACILVEPMQGATGCIPAAFEFLTMLRDESHVTNTVLIFDEVMTSRLSISGLQGQFQITPDMTTLGKYIGGGMSFGAFGGREEIMQLFDPRRSDVIPHAGTFNNNSLTMAAGVAAMTQVLSDQVLDELNQRGEKMRLELNKACSEYGVAVQFIGIGSLIAMHNTIEQIQSSKNLTNTDDRISELIFLDLLERAYYIARRGFMALMLPLTDVEADGFVHAFREILKERRHLFY